MLSSNVLDFKELLLDKLSEENLSIYDDDPLWDEEKRSTKGVVKNQIELQFAYCPEPLQLEINYWAISNRILGEYRFEGISALDTYVFTGKSVFECWFFFTEYVVRTPQRGSDAKLRRELITPDFKRMMPDKRQITPQELEYIIHSRQLEYGFRCDPLPDIDPIKNTFNLAEEKRRHALSDLIWAGKEDGIPIFNDIWA